MPDIIASAYDAIAGKYVGKEKSFAEVEVGDIKQPGKFYPQAKIKRWDNECNFSVRLVHDEKAPVVSVVDNKIQWVGEKVEAHFYEVEGGKEGGGYELEIVLKEPPKSNVISMTLQTKGLDFFYQPDLTLEETKYGASRPENVVGSYAVYHQTMAGDHTALGGKNYQAGKAFHIYRPRLEDANGTWVWGELNIDDKTGLLTVTIPQDFLDKAVYPVRHAAGLEFGYHTGGASEVSSDLIQCRLGKAVTSPAFSGVLTKIYVYTYSPWTNASRVNPAIYADDGGSPSKAGAKLAAIDSGGTIPTSLNWYGTSIAYSGLLANTVYWIGSRGQSGYYNITRYDTGVANEDNYIASGSTWNDPFGSTASFGYRYSFYGEYTPAGSLLIHPGMEGGLNRPALNGGLNG